MDSQEETQQAEDNRIALEHRKVLNDIRAIITTNPGRDFFKYLFKTLDVTGHPEPGLPRDELLDRLGCLRAGRSIFNIVSQANPEIAGALIAENEKEYHAQILYENAVGQD